MAFKSLIQNAALLGVTLLILLLVAELALAFVFNVPLGQQVPDSTLIYKNVPYAKIPRVLSDYGGLTYLNSEGFHDKEITEKTNGVFRIVVFGDSFIESTQTLLNQTVPSIMESKLKGRNYEVINRGVSSYTTTKHLKALNVYGEQLSPDLVIATFTVSNDLISNLEDPLFSVKDSLLIENEVAPPSIIVKSQRLLASKSHLFSMIDRTLLIELSNSQTVGLLLSKLGITRTVVVEEVSTPLAFEKYAKQTDHPKAYVKTKLVMSALKERSDELGAEFMFVVLPAKEQVNSAYRDELFEDLGVSNLPVNMAKVNEFLESTCKELEITCIDMLPYFLNHSDPQSLFYLNNDHWNEAGQFYTALVVSEEIMRGDNG